MFPIKIKQFKNAHSKATRSYPIVFKTLKNAEKMSQKPHLFETFFLIDLLNKIKTDNKKKGNSGIINRF